jgi:uncharacterized phage-associated protein
MIINREREKLIEAILFFASNAGECSKTKLLKLLYLLDFGHFSQTGRSVTGLDYFAWELGPVSIDVLKEFEIPSADLLAAVEVKSANFGSFPGVLITPKRQPNTSVFSRRELELMESIANKYKRANASEMVEVTHVENHAWDRTWQGGMGKNHKINYELSIDDKDYEHIKELMDEGRDFRKAFSG